MSKERFMTCNDDTCFIIYLAQVVLQTSNSITYGNNLRTFVCWMRNSLPLKLTFQSYPWNLTSTNSVRSFRLDIKCKSSLAGFDPSRTFLNDVCCEFPSFYVHLNFGCSIWKQQQIGKRSWWWHFQLRDDPYHKYKIKTNWK